MQTSRYKVTGLTPLRDYQKRIDNFLEKHGVVSDFYLMEEMKKDKPKDSKVTLEEMGTCVMDHHMRACICKTKGDCPLIRAVNAQRIAVEKAHAKRVDDNRELSERERSISNHNIMKDLERIQEDVEKLKLCQASSDNSPPTKQC